MTMREKINPVFQSCDDEANNLEPIVFNVPATYSDKVKIHDWQMRTLAEPLDNREIFPPKGNLYVSSYRRLGPYEGCTGISETRAMLSQIELKHEYERIYPQRTLLNMRSLVSSLKQDKQEEPSLANILLDAEEARRMDYRTTMEVDYRLPYAIKPKPPPPPPPPEPWLLNRRTIGYSLNALEKRDGIHTFLDDNMELHDRIADLKMRRNTLHETILKDNPPPSFTNAAQTAKEDLHTICH